jgi:hypothetical protein
MSILFIYFFYWSIELFLNWLSQLNHIKPTPIYFNFKFEISRKLNKKVSQYQIILYSLNIFYYIKQTINMFFYNLFDVSKALLKKIKIFFSVFRLF